MGLSVFIPTGDNHGDPLISPFCSNITCQFCRSVAHRTYTEDFCSFRTPDFGASLWSSGIAWAWVTFRRSRGLRVPAV